MYMMSVEVVQKREINITSELKNWNLVPIESGPPHPPIIFGNDTKTVVVRKGPAGVERSINYYIVHKVNDKKIARLKLDFSFDVVKGSADIVEEEIKGFVLCESNVSGNVIDCVIKMTSDSDIIAEAHKWLVSAPRIEV
jgi:hypothetical protein